jgi:hypothetical protein
MPECGTCKGAGAVWTRRDASVSKLVPFYDEDLTTDPQWAKIRCPSCDGWGRISEADADAKKEAG